MYRINYYNYYESDFKDVLLESDAIYEARELTKMGYVVYIEMLTDVDFKFKLIDSKSCDLLLETVYIREVERYIDNFIYNNLEQNDKTCRYDEKEVKEVLDGFILYDPVDYYQIHGYDFENNKVDIY